MGEERKITRIEKIKIKILEHIDDRDLININYNSSLTMYDIPDGIAIMIKQSDYTIEEGAKILNELIKFFNKDIIELEELYDEKLDELDKMVCSEKVGKEMNSIIIDTKKELEKTKEQIEEFESNIEEVDDEVKKELLEKDLKYLKDIEEIRTNFIDMLNDAVVELELEIEKEL